MPESLTCRVVAGARAERVLLLVHGLGADEHDLAPAVPYLDPDGAFHVVLPRGPLAMAPGAAWFAFGGGGMDREGYLRSLGLLRATLADACASGGFDATEAVVAGFSQGACMVLGLGYSRPATGQPGATDTPDGATPAGVLAMSGFLPRLDDLPLAPPGPTWPPALVQHGTRDPLVDPARGFNTVQTLRSRGVPVVHREYPMGHEISLDSLRDARDWLAAVRRGERPGTVD